MLYEFNGKCLCGQEHTWIVPMLLAGIPGRDVSQTACLHVWERVFSSSQKSHCHLGDVHVHPCEINPCLTGIEEADQSLWSLRSCSEITQSCRPASDECEWGRMVLKRESDILKWGSRQETNGYGDWHQQKKNKGYSACPTKLHYMIV